MKRVTGAILIVFAVLLYLMGLWVLAKELQYSMASLWFTLTNGALLGSFIATGLGAFAPGAIVHYLGYRLRRSTKATP